MHLIGLVTLNCLLFRPLILLSVVRFLTILSPFKGCARSPLSLALGARANCRTSFLCSPDSCCNKTYLCFGQTAMMTLPATFTLNENCRTWVKHVASLCLHFPLQTFKFRSVQPLFQHPQCDPGQLATWAKLHLWNLSISTMSAPTLEPKIPVNTQIELSQMPPFLTPSTKWSDSSFSQLYGLFL